MPKLSFESMPYEAYQPHFADVKYLSRIVELQAKQKEIEEKITSTEGDEKKILEMNLKNIKKQIFRYNESFSKHGKIKQLGTLKKIAGDNNVAEIIDFKKKQKNEKKDFEVSNDFLNSLEEFKARKN